MTTPMPSRTVILFGLSANPPTGMGGHAGIVQWAIEQPSFSELNGRPADEIWILPVFVHAFEDKRDMPSFEHRLEMARLNFLSLPGAQGRVHVLATERDVAQHPQGTSPSSIVARHDQTQRQTPTPTPTPTRIGTIDVVRYLLARHPNTEFALLLGGDTFDDLHHGRWKESDALRALVKVIRIPRRGPAAPPHKVGSLAPARLGPSCDHAPASSPETSTQALESGPTLTDISSTAVRRSDDLVFLKGALRPAVLDYIQRHHLYRIGGQGLTGMPGPPPDSDI